MPQDSKSRKLDQYIVRFPDGMRDELKAAAENNNRSMNAEIVERLQDYAAMQKVRDHAFEVSRINARQRDDIERLEWEIDRLKKVRERFFDDAGNQKPVLTIPQPLLDRIALAAEENHRTMDAEALAALETAFPPKAIDINLLSLFLNSLVGVSAPDGDKDYLRAINDALAGAKQPWTVKAGWDGEVRFYPYASPSREQDGTQQADDGPPL